MSIFSRLQAKKQNNKNAIVLRTEMNQKLSYLTKDLDAKTLEIIEDLASRLGPLKTLDSWDFESLVNEHLTGYLADNGGIAFGTIDAACKEGLVADVDKLSKRQFATFAENYIYTEGTKDLLSLLTQYHRVVTEKAVITAVPDSSVHLEDRAVITMDDLVSDLYDDTRAVYVSIITETIFIMFGFEEKVK